MGRVGLPAGADLIIVSGSKVVVGQRAEEVASFGWFSPPELRPLVERSDSAMHYQEILDANYKSGKVMMWGGLAMASAVIWRFSFSSLHDSESGTGDWITAGVGVAGLVLGFIGGRRLDRANEAFSQTIWWYNESLVDPSPEDDSKAPADPRPTANSGDLERRR